MIQNETIEVSPVQQQDYTQWLEYWVAYQNFYQVNLPSISQKDLGSFFDEKNLFIVQLPKIKNVS